MRAAAAILGGAAVGAAWFVWASLRDLREPWRVSVAIDPTPVGSEEGLVDPARDESWTWRCTFGHEHDWLERTCSAGPYTTMSPIA
jgi:hypothetical protein